MAELFPLDVSNIGSYLGSFSVLYFLDLSGKTIKGDLNTQLIIQQIA
jgi:hypothetical protein